MARSWHQRSHRDDRCPLLSTNYVAQPYEGFRHKDKHKTLFPRSARPCVAVSVAPATLSLAPMTATPSPEKAIRSLVSNVASSFGFTVQALEAVPSARVQLLYTVKISEGPDLLLALPPPPGMQLLRNEDSSVESEAAVLKWLSQQEREIKSTKTPVGSKTSNEDHRPKVDMKLEEYLPVLFKHGSVEGNTPLEYNLYRPPRGVPVSTLPEPLSRRDRQRVDFQVGQMLRRISNQLSPNQRFGLAMDVLAVPPSAARLRRMEGGLHQTKGASSWPVAFHALLESVLRDGEDKSIMISYGAIRRHFRRLEHLLHAVTKPRLVVVDIGQDVNTLVVQKDPKPKPKTDVETSGPGTRNMTREKEDSKSTECRSETSGSRGSSQSSTSEIEGDDDPDASPYHSIEVTGLRQWSNCIFGDPLIASVFIQNSNQDLHRGFGSDVSEQRLIEDEAHAPVRLLLYECYHAATAVVREFYRPRSDDGEAELRARRQLAGVLARLDAVDDEGFIRRRRMSGEVSPAKRVRQDKSDKGK